MSLVSISPLEDQRPVHVLILTDAYIPALNRLVYSMAGMKTSERYLHEGKNDSICSLLKHPGAPIKDGVLFVSLSDIKKKHLAQLCERLERSGKTVLWSIYELPPQTKGKSDSLIARIPQHLHEVVE